MSIYMIFLILMVIFLFFGKKPSLKSFGMQNYGKAQTDIRA